MQAVLRVGANIVFDAGVEHESSFKHDAQLPQAMAQLNVEPTMVALNADTHDATPECYVHKVVGGMVVKTKFVMPAD